MKRLRQIRQARNLSLRDLERLSGVDYSSISKIETGDVEPRLNTIIKIAKALNISLDELVEVATVH